MNRVSESTLPSWENPKPARLFVRPDRAFLSDLVIRQGITIGVFGLAVALVYRAALRRIHSNGG